MTPITDSMESRQTLQRMDRADEDERDNATARLIEAERDAKAEIREAFALIGQIPMSRIALSQVQHSGYGDRMKVGSTSLLDACLELMHDGQVDDELTAILEKSECALVAKLRIALRDRYIAANALDVAEARVE